MSFHGAMTAVFIGGPLGSSSRVWKLGEGGGIRQRRLGGCCAFKIDENDRSNRQTIQQTILHPRGFYLGLLAIPPDQGGHWYGTSPLSLYVWVNIFRGS